MKLSISQNQVISKRDFKATDIDNVFTNKGDNEVAFVEKDHSIVFQNDEKENEIE